MARTAKYLFDEDFATGEKPTISVVEAERRREDAESLAYRKGFAAGEAKTPVRDSPMRTRRSKRSSGCSARC